MLGDVTGQALHDGITVTARLAIILPTLCSDNLECVLHHEVKLFELRIFAFCPVVHLRAEVDNLRQCLLEHIFVVNFDLERELTGTSDRSNVKLGGEALFLAADANEEVLDLIEDDLPISLTLMQAFLYVALESNSMLG